MQNRTATYIFITEIFLLLFAVPFLFRAADDNSLFSWAWVFSTISVSRISFFLVLGLVLSFYLSIKSIPEACHVPVLALTSFAAAAPFWGESELILDASRYFTQAKHLEVYGVVYFLKEWGKAIPAWTDLPLVPFLYGVIFKVFGESRLAIQLFTTVLFSLTTVLIYHAGRMLWNRETGFSAGLLILGIPYLLTQVPLMLVDVPTMFFLMLALTTFLDAVQRGGALRIACASIAVACTVLAKYSAWFMLSVLGIVLIVNAFQNIKSKEYRLLWRGVVILFIAAALAGAALFPKIDVVMQQLAFLREYQGPGLSRWGESLTSTFLFQIHPMITLSLFAALAVAIQKRDMNVFIVSWLILLVAIFGIKRIRYTLPIFPLITLMAGYGLQIIKQDQVKRFILYGTVMSSLVIAIFAYLPFSENMSPVNLKHAGAYLNSLGTEEIEVITINPRDPVANLAVTVDLLDLFTHKKIRYHYLPEGFPPVEEIKKSSLRFTWEYRNPEYYAAYSASPAFTPVVVLSDLSDAPLSKKILRRLKGYQLSASFYTSEAIFQHNVGVRVFQKTM